MMRADLHIHELVVALSGKQLLEHLSHTFKCGTVTLILGNNGSGKTILLETLAGLRKPQSGKLQLGHLPLWGKHKPARELLLMLGYAAQQPEQQLFARTIQEEFNYTCRPYRDAVLPQSLASAKRTVIDMLDDQHQGLSSDPFLLSGGQKRRLSLALLDAANPLWLLLDEPTVGLDQSQVSLIRDRLHERKASGQGTIVVTHEPETLLEAADQIVLLSEGRIVWTGSPDELAQNPQLFERAGMAIPEQLETNRLLRGMGYAIPSGWPSAAVVAERIAAGPTINDRLEPAVPQVCETAIDNRNAIPQRPAARMDRYDPRMIWLAYMLLTPGIMLQSSWAGWLLCAALALLVVRFTGVPPSLWRKPALALSLFTLVVTIAAGMKLEAGFTFDSEAAIATFYYFGKLVMVMLIGLALLAGISPLRLKRALEQGLSGMARLRIQFEPFALTAAITVRFIPILSDEWRRFALIAAARGKYAHRPGRVPFKHLHATAIPFLIALLRIGDALTNMLTARGIGRIGYQPSMAERLNWGKLDGWLLLGSMLVLTGLIGLEMLVYS